MQFTPITLPRRSASWGDCGTEAGACQSRGCRLVTPVLECVIELRPDIRIIRNCRHSGLVIRLVTMNRRAFTAGRQEHSTDEE